MQHGAQVVNLSVADNPVAQRPLDLSFESAVDWAWAAGAVPVIASGNSNSSLGPGQENFSNLNALVVGGDGRMTERPLDMADTDAGPAPPGDLAERRTPAPVDPNDIPF